MFNASRSGGRAQPQEALSLLALNVNINTGLPGHGLQV